MIVEIIHGAYSVMLGIAERRVIAGYRIVGEGELIVRCVRIVAGRRKIAVAIGSKRCRRGRKSILLVGDCE
jgi:DNA-binding cell septation regulator SpoVG